MRFLGVSLGAGRGCWLNRPYMEEMLEGAGGGDCSATLSPMMFWMIALVARSIIFSSSAEKMLPFSACCLLFRHFLLIDHVVAGFTCVHKNG